MVNYGRTYRELKLHICPKSVQIKKAPDLGRIRQGQWVGVRAVLAGRMYANVLTFHFLALAVVFRLQPFHYIDCRSCLVIWLKAQDHEHP